MDNFLNNLQGSLAEIFTALIASAIAFIGLVIAKENKTSEFRQAWIDALRGDISDYIAAARVIAQAHMRFDNQKNGDKGELEFAQTMQEVYLSSSSSLARIRMRINPNDSNPELRKLNESLLEDAKNIQMNLANENYRESLVISNRLHKEASEILKLEWERVKSGEPIYRISKVVALVLFSALLLLLGYGYLIAK